GPEDTKLAIHRRHVDLAVGPDRRALGVAAVVLRPQLLTRLGVEAVHLGRLVADVEPAVVQDRRAVLDLVAGLGPDDLRLPLLDLRPVRADDAPLFVAVEVLLAVADVTAVAVSQGRAIARPGAEEVAPALLAGAAREGVDAAVGPAADQQPLAA